MSTFKNNQLSTVTFPQVFGTVVKSSAVFPHQLPFAIAEEESFVAFTVFELFKSFPMNIEFSKIKEVLPPIAIASPLAAVLFVNTHPVINPASSDCTSK